MFVRLNRSLRLASLALLAGSLLAGCRTGPYPTDFDTAEELDRYLQETELLHRRAKVDIKGGALVPFDSDMETGPGFGVKLSLEAFKNLFFGIEYDFATHDIDENLEDFQKVFDSDPAQGNALARNADPEQWLEDFDRHDILFTFDYHVRLGDGWGLYTPVFRTGVGVGAVLINGNEVPNSTLASDVDARLFANFLVRPWVAVDFPVHKNVQFFVEAAADLMPDGELTIDGKLADPSGNHQRTEIEDSVNFSAFAIFGGVTFTW